jgi:hypothetical protein
MLNKKGDVMWPVIITVIVLIAFLMVYLFAIPSGKNFLMRAGEYMREVMRIGG